MLRKLAISVITRGHLVRVLNERRVSEGGDLCPLWLVILKSVRQSNRKHPIAAKQLAVTCSELYFDRCCALKRTGACIFASENKVTCFF